MPLLLAAGLVLAGKVFLIVSFGDMRLGDNDLLMRYADAILAGTDWLATADADRLAIPPTLWKPVGYPLFIAASVVFVLYEWSLPFSTDALLMPDALYGRAWRCSCWRRCWREGWPLGIAGAAASAMARSKRSRGSN